MAKKWQPMSDEEFERQYAEGVKHGAEVRAREPKASQARYDAASGRLILEMHNGATFIVPTDLLQGLHGAPPELLAEVELWSEGTALHWERLDADFRIPALLLGVFGGKTWMSELGRAGGAVTSPAKAAAARENGKKGGRPAKKRDAA